MNYELIKNLTTKCPSGTLINGQDNFKISSIINEIDKSEYNISVENGYILVTNKFFDNQKKFISLSSHIDNVYNNCFCNIDNEFLRGTFDNSLTNYAMLDCIRNLKQKQIIYIFTDNEELNNSTIINVSLLKNNNFLFNVCLDVTPYCHYTHVATIENDYYGLNKIKNKKVAYIQPYQSMNDESNFLQTKNLKSFSFCVTCDFSENRCHSENGGIISIKKYKAYIKMLKKLLNDIIF